MSKKQKDDQETSQNSPQAESTQAPDKARDQQDMSLGQLLTEQISTTAVEIVSGFESEQND